LRQLAVYFLCKAEIVGALDGHFLCDLENPANDVEIVFLRFFVDHAVDHKSSARASASLGMRSANPTLPEIRSSDNSRALRGRRDLTANHSPADRASPPPTNSGRRPNVTPSPTNFRYASLASEARLPNCASTLSQSCHSANHRSPCAMPATHSARA